MGEIKHTNGRRILSNIMFGYGFGKERKWYGIRAKIEVNGGGAEQEKQKKVVEWGVEGGKV